MLPDKETLTPRPVELILIHSSSTVMHDQCVSLNVWQQGAINIEGQYQTDVETRKDHFERVTKKFIIFLNVVYYDDETSFLTTVRQVS